MTQPRLLPARSMLSQLLLAVLQVLLHLQVGMSLKMAVCSFKLADHSTGRCPKESLRSQGIAGQAITMTSAWPWRIMAAQSPTLCTPAAQAVDTA